MKYTHYYEPVQNIQIITISGNYNRLKDACEIRRFCIDFYKETGCIKYLTNLRGVTEFSGSTIDIYKAAHPPQEISLILYKLSIAALYATIDGDSEFFENVERNQGYRVKNFTSYEKSMAWLIRY